MTVAVETRPARRTDASRASLPHPLDPPTDAPRTSGWTQAAGAGAREVSVIRAFTIFARPQRSLCV